MTTEPVVLAPKRLSAPHLIPRSLLAGRALPKPSPEDLRCQAYWREGRPPDAVDGLDTLDGLRSYLEQRIASRWIDDVAAFFEGYGSAAELRGARYLAGAPA